MMILKGIIEDTGGHDTGKTTFALECGASPERICFVDDDIKGRATVEEMRATGTQWGAYYDLAALDFKTKLLDFHEKCLKIIDSIEADQFDVLVWDTWSRFMDSCRIYVKANPDKFRSHKFPKNPRMGGGWASQGDIKGAEMNKEGTLYEASLLGTLASKIPTIILVTHLKDYYVGRTKIDGKEVPASGKTLARVPRMRVWLRQNPSGSPVPVGLFLKRFDRKRYIDGIGIRTTCVVPRKIVPHEEDRSLWDAIWRYWDNPIGNRLPTPEETPDEFELSILDGTLTADQRRTFRLMLEAGAIRRDEEESPRKPGSAFSVKKSDDWKTRVQRMAQEGKSLTEIVAEVKKPSPIVKAVIGGNTQ